MAREDQPRTGASRPAQALESGTAPMPTTLPADADAYDAALAYADAQAADPDNPALLQAWLRAFPQFGEELRAVSWQIWTSGADWRGTGAADDADPDPAIAAAGRSVLASLFPPEPRAAPLTSLIAEAGAHGLSVQDLAQAVRLDVPLLARLEQRLIRASTLPRALVERLAQTLERPLSDVAAYLRGGPRLAAHAHYKARQAPRAGEQTDFAAVLALSSPETRDAWQGSHALLGDEKEAGEEAAQ